MLTNLLAYGGRCWLVTVTAPGQDVLPWDAGTGKVELHAAHEWNRTAQRRWSELHRRALQACRRSGHDVQSLARVWQLQKRGVLHLHLVLGVESPAEMAAARVYVAELRSRTREHGYGFVDARDRDGKTGKSTVMEPQRVAGYLAPYLTSDQMSEAIDLRGRPRRLVWVSPRLTRVTGCTMRRLRLARYLYVLRERRVIVSMAGRLPAWLRDPVEAGKVASLLRPSIVPAGP